MEIDFLEADYYYHLYNRGINREILFKEEVDYYKFLELCKKYLIPYFDLLAYCLLPNHFHFLLYIHEISSKSIQSNAQHEVSHPYNFSLPLSHLFNSYAQWYNKKTGRTGSLFQRPFKRKRITSEEYLKQAIYYIHRNPMHHNIVQKPENWIFSSYRNILNDKTTLVKCDRVLEWFGNRRNFIDYHRMQFVIDSEQFEK
jgi:REP element-mobilizing transposase RayT